MFTVSLYYTPLNDEIHVPFDTLAEARLFWAENAWVCHYDGDIRDAEGNIV